MSKIKDFFINKEWLLLLMFVVVFVLVRLPGVDSPLHQDEYKWPMIVNPSYASDTEIPHPPLSQFIYRMAGEVVGYDVDFRFVPLFFGILNLFLLSYFLRTFFGRREAIIGGLIWIFSYFSVLASLMVDTDGQIMPFFFLLALIGYYKSGLSSGREKIFWFGLLFISLLVGFFVKLSFVLVICAFVVNFFWERKSNITKKDLFKYASYVLVGALFLALLLVISQYVFSFFDLEKSFTYWKHFLITDRGWMQTAIQCIKAVFYASPFLVLVPLFKPKLVFEKARIFVFFLLFAFVFYVVLFDFSIGALDRYLQLMILPLTIMSSIIISSINFRAEKRTKEFLLLGVIFALVLFLLQSIPHSVYALHPKAEWISRVVSLRWNFLYPFSGGSGPLGFYISFLFIGLSWVVSLGVLALSYIKYNLKNVLIVFLIPIGLVYNLAFTLEYLFGYQNGSAPKLLNNVVEFIKNEDNIKMVTVYNDNGGNEIRSIGKYRKRLYTDPAFGLEEKIATLNTYKEHYLEIDVPKIDPNSVYRKYLDSCEVIYKETDKSISATVYDCRSILDVNK